MGLDAVIMMVAILGLVWGGFIGALAHTFRQEKGSRKEEASAADADS